MKMMGPSIGDACPETCAGGKISGATVVAGNSIVPTFKTTIKMAGDCGAFDVAVAAAKLAAQLGVEVTPMRLYEGKLVEGAIRGIQCGTSVSALFTQDMAADLLS